jgi:hypothetical protein
VTAPTPTLPYLRPRTNGSILHIPRDFDATGWQPALCGTVGREPGVYRRVDKVCRICTGKLLGGSA